MAPRPNRLISAILGLAISVAGQSGFAAETLTPSIWIDPDGCEHWVIDDGAEGYMSPHLQRDGRPVCRDKDICGVVETDLLFEFNSFIVTQTGRARLVSVLRGSPARAYIVTGHTDNVGSDEANMELAQNRADAVAELMRGLGAPITDVVAYGERFPRDTNKTDRGRRENRRVEILCLR